MKVERREGSIERRVATAMIVDSVALGRIAAKWEKGGLFPSTWSNLVGTWAADYYERYGEAPGKQIVGLFESWASEQSDKETVDLVERFLESLSDEWDSLAQESNSDYVVDLAGKLFNQTKAAKLASNIKGDLERGDVDKALSRITKFHHVEVGASTGINVIADKGAMRQAFARKSNSIIKYPGALGEFYKDALERDAFVAFMAPEKTGKTFHLMDMAWRGMLQSQRVAFFGVGDMTEGQMLLRFAARVMRRPLKATTKKTGPIRYPISIEHHPDDKQATVNHDLREYAEDLDWREAWRASRKLLRKKQLDPDLLKMSCVPNSSISVAGISSVLETWERAGWGSPDVVVVDYADILAPPNGIVESRDQINATWKGLRRLSQERHCLVVTATQSDAASYEAEMLRRQNFSEDKRKYAHVTAMVGISQTGPEKLVGLQRLNWLVLREGEFFESQCVHVAGCLAVANPAILSTF